MQTAHPEALECVLLIDGSYELESELHQRFKEHWVRGEWFHWGPAFVEYAAEARAAGRDLSNLVRANLVPTPSSDMPWPQFAESLKTRSGLSIRQIADALGVSKTSVASLIRCQNPGLDNMARYLEFMGATYTIG